MLIKMRLYLYGESIDGVALLQEGGSITDEPSCGAERPAPV
jgi:hypothetical protein